jgi:hypothetical protein
VLAAPAEEPGRLDAEVPDLLLAAVERARRERRLERVLGRFRGLLVRRRHALLLCLLGLEVLVHWPEVALCQVGDVHVVALRGL